MKYYISISAWNLLESFTTESISPVSFYSERAFGAKLSRLLQDKYDRSYQLILSAKDNGGDYTIEIDETLIDQNLLNSEKSGNLFSYPKTIYYQKGLVSFRFNTKELMDSLIAESKILFEVKCIDKYLSDFYVKEKNPVSVNLDIISNTLSFDYQNYILEDNRFNLIKGAITGYARGVITSQSIDSYNLHIKVGELKNALAGLNTVILMSNGEISDANKYILMIDDCKNLYLRQREEPTRIFDIMKQQFNEIIKLSAARASVIDSNRCTIRRDTLNAEIYEIKNKMLEIEEANNIGIYSEELESIKMLERENGKTVGKKRFYFKAGTPEYERKQILKRILNDFSTANSQYKKLKEDLQKLYAKQNERINDVEILDGAIQAIFTRLSDLSNEIIKKIIYTNNRNSLDLSAINIGENIRIESSKVPQEELSFFNCMLDVILNNPFDGPISEYVILNFVEKGTKAFMEQEESKTQTGEKIVNCMRRYWQYKNHKSASFDIPADMEVIKSIVGFLMKPFGFDQIERYLINKKCMYKEYAFMLWGACIGYANMPKTFTEVLYSDPNEVKKLDKFLKKLML